jgi:hypothetical protein
MSFKLDIDTSGTESAFDAYEAFNEARIQRAMLRATDRGSRNLRLMIRAAMAAAGFGRLGQAYGARSDAQSGRGVHPQADGGFSASGMLYVRTRSERTRGALASYTRGSEIAPVRGRWLWIPTPDAPRISRRARLTPGDWSASGLDSRIGPLVMIKSVDGRPLLVVRNVGVSLAGRAHSARSLTKTGRARKGQVEKPFVVMFVAIPRTSRAARVDIDALHRQVMSELPAILSQEIRKA